MSFDFGTVYVRDTPLGEVVRALDELMAESAHLPTRERGLEPTPDAVTSAKRIRSFALLPLEDDWTTVIEDGHARDDGGVAEGLSDILQTETLAFTYSDVEGEWTFTRYWEGQPLEAGGADDEDFDVSAREFIDSQSLPHFGVYYEEVAAAADGDAPSLSGSLEVVGDIRPRVPMGTEVVTYVRNAPVRIEEPTA
ncbi:MAG: hypothetical protein JO219_03180 [Candidatus Eremiobacteraeota bacterium]|nr:hypothetical protein [Candidatus Eremiobacteraeota bacterium]MBV8365660.1 hypothetical protein [Candidatus Eremiobacteraeota bacterium]